MLTSKHIKLFTSAFLVAMALSSCLNLDETKDSSYGYLTISGFDVDIQVEQLLPTKAGETTVNISEIAGYSAPELSSVTVVRKDDPSKTYTWNAGETLSLPAGTYTLSATDGTNAFDAPYFEGTGEVDVTAGNTSTGTVIFTLGNSVMKVTMADGFNQHFTPVGENPVTISSALASANAKMNEYVFIPSGTQLTVHIDGKNSAGVEKDFAITTTAERNTAYDVVLSAAGITMPSITLPDQQNGAWGGRLYVNPVTSVTGMSSDNLAKIVYEVYSDSECNTLVSSSSIGTVVVNGLTNGATYYVRARVGNLVSDIKTITVVAPIVTNTHYNDSDGNLAGTNAVLDLQLNDFLKEKVEIGDVVLSNGDTQMRTATASGTMDVTNNWPYLPQGNGYILTIPHKLKDESSYTECKVSGVSVPAPEFKVNTGAYTSYSKYVSGDVSGANSCDAGTIYNLQSVTPAISASLLNNENYKSTVSKSVSLDNSSTSSETATDQSWGSHTVTASYTFAGTTCSDNHTLHITGLPYESGVPSNTGSHSWSKVKGTIDWGASYVSMSWSTGAYPTIESPTYHIPGNINVNVQSKLVRNKYTFLGSSIHGSYRVGATNATTDVNDRIVDVEVKSEKQYEGTAQGIMSPTVTKWYVQYSYMATGPVSYLHYFNIYYR